MLLFISRMSWDICVNACLCSVMFETLKVSYPIVIAHLQMASVFCLFVNSFMIISIRPWKKGDKKYLYTRRCWRLSTAQPTQSANKLAPNCRKESLRLINYGRGRSENGVELSLCLHASEKKKNYLLSFLYSKSLLMTILQYHTRHMKLILRMHVFGIQAFRYSSM
jgi:hypothetical protein